MWRRVNILVLQHSPTLHKYYYGWEIMYVMDNDEFVTLQSETREPVSLKAILKPSSFDPSYSEMDRPIKKHCSRQ